MPYSSVLMPDLTICDVEPITRLDRIQNFGFLIALSNEWTVVRASANLSAHIGIEAGAALGKSFAAIVNPAALAAIRGRSAMLHATGNERMFGVSLTEGLAKFDLNLHFLDDVLIVEGEPSKHDDIVDAISMVRSLFAQINQTPGFDAFYQLGTNIVRRFTGFDRVMVYRFESDDHGEVIAETISPGIESFLGLHYPASDIPKQARALYLRNPFRIISDVNATPVVLLSMAAASVPPIDLSQAITRAVSPVHIEYLTNMGVAATLSISIIVGGRLWGLFVCHNYAPWLPGYVMRTAAEVFGSLFSLALESRLALDARLVEQRVRLQTDQMVAQIVADTTLLTDPQWINGMIGEIIQYDGIALFRAGDVFCHGSTPSKYDIAALARYIDLASPTQIFSTDCISSLSVPGFDSSAAVAGMLAIPISSSHQDYILLFRGEYLQSIKWGGEPIKFSSAEDSLRLSPRKSFAAFSETIRGKSRMFSEGDLRAGEAIRTAIRSAILELNMRISAASVNALAEEINTRRVMATAIAHELNQPLSAVSDYLSGLAMLAETGEANDATLAKFAEISRRAATQAVRASDILKMLRNSITRDDTSRTDEDIGLIIKETISVIFLNTDNREVAIKFDQPAVRMGAIVNKTQIRQVIANLVDNAVEAVSGMDRREVTITIRRDPLEQLLEVDVADTGPGLPPEQVPHLFRPYTSKKPHGMGIGLSISREIIEGHNGRIWFLTNADSGATFCFTLPTSGSEVES